MEQHVEQEIERGGVGLLNKFLNVLKKRILWWGLVIIAAFISKLFLHSNFLFWSILVIPIIHELLSYMLRKNIITKDSPHLVLWIGFISTFIGFSFSQSFQDYQKQKEITQKIVSVVTESAESNEAHLKQAEHALTLTLLEYDAGKEPTYPPIGYDEQDISKVILDDAELLMHSSTGFRKAIGGFDFNSVYFKEYPNETTYNTILALNYRIRDLKFRKKLCAMELSYQKEKEKNWGDKDLDIKYYKEYQKITDEYVKESEDINNRFDLDSH